MYIVYDMGSDKWIKYFHSLTTTDTEHDDATGLESEYFSTRSDKRGCFSARVNSYAGCIT
jgi:hypothetical protein